MCREHSWMRQYDRSSQSSRYTPLPDDRLSFPQAQPGLDRGCHCAKVIGKPHRPSQDKPE